MAAPNLATEAAAAGAYPSNRFNQRERKLLESVKDYLDTSIAPSHIVLLAGEHTTAGGSASESITLASVKATDIVIASLKTKGTSPVTLDTAAAAAGEIDLTFSGDPSTDHVVSYLVLRANS